MGSWWCLPGRKAGLHRRTRRRWPQRAGAKSDEHVRIPDDRGGFGPGGYGSPYCVARCRAGEAVMDAGSESLHRMRRAFGRAAGCVSRRCGSHAAAACAAAGLQPLHGGGCGGWVAVRCVGALAAVRGRARRARCADGCLARARCGSGGAAACSGRRTEREREERVARWREELGLAASSETLPGERQATRFDLPADAPSLTALAATGFHRSSSTSTSVCSPADCARSPRRPSPRRRSRRSASSLPPWAPTW